MKYNIENIKLIISVSTFFTHFQYLEISDFLTSSCSDKIAHQHFPMTAESEDSDFAQTGNSHREKCLISAFVAVHVFSLHILVRAGSQYILCQHGGKKIHSPHTICCLRISGFTLKAVNKRCAYGRNGKRNSRCIRFIYRPPTRLSLF